MGKEKLQRQSLVSGPRAPGSRRRGNSLPVMIGALFGGGLSSAVYFLVNPMLERSSGLVRETQGMLWSAIPVCTVLGAIVARAIVRGHSKRP